VIVYSNIRLIFVGNLKLIIMRKLSLLSLLVIVGFAVVGLTNKTNFIWVGYLLIAIGSFAFGTLFILIFKKKLFICN
jgi:hypothetical protein